MIALIIFGLIFISVILFAIVRVSVTCMFWCSKKPNDKQYVFKTSFPYYIIVLAGLCATVIIKFEANSFFNYLCGSIFFLALLIWRFEMKNSLNTNLTIQETDESHNPNLP